MNQRCNRTNLFFTGSKIGGLLNATMGNIPELFIGYFAIKAGFRLGVIIKNFALSEQTQKHGGIFYRKLPVLGHFGDNALALPWERLDKAEWLAGKQ